MMLFLLFRRQKCAAFSLVEVVLALAIASFAIVAILGLLTLGLQETAASQAQTVASLVARDANIRARQFWTNIATTPLPPGGMMASNNFYYTETGAYTNNPGPSALYMASVVVCGLNAANYPDTTLTWDKQLAGQTVTVRWPINAAGVSLSAINQISFTTEIAKVTDPRWPTATSYTFVVKP